MPKRLKLNHNPLSSVPHTQSVADNTSSLPYNPTPPLPSKNFVMYIVGAPQSGKTNLWVEMMLSKKPRYYRKFFDFVCLMTPSADTLPKKVVGKNGLPESQIYNTLDDETLDRAIALFRSGYTNTNNLLIIDDMIRDIARSKKLSKIFLNRRNITYDRKKEDYAGLSVMVISQKYNMLPLEFRNACSHMVIFKTENSQELKAIKDEIMMDLNNDDQNAVLDAAWREPHSFLFIDVNGRRGERYHVKFDPIVEMDDI
jgi:hypothetical protein